MRGLPGLLSVVVGVDSRRLAASPGVASLSRLLQPNPTAVGIASSPPSRHAQAELHLGAVRSQNCHGVSCEFSELGSLTRSRFGHEHAQVERMDLLGRSPSRLQAEVARPSPSALAGGLDGITVFPQHQQAPSALDWRAVFAAAVALATLVGGLAEGLRGRCTARAFSAKKAALEGARLPRLASLVPASIAESAPRSGANPKNLKRPCSTRPSIGVASLACLPAPGARGTVAESRSASCVRRCALGADESPDDFDDFESLNAALQLAQRSGDDARVAEVRKRLEEAEMLTPMRALAWQQKNKIREAQEAVLFGASDPVARRVEAIHSLRALATPPASHAEAEDALFKILRDVSGRDASTCRAYADNALWDSWLTYGDEIVDGKMTLGIRLMEDGSNQEAMKAFDELVELAPDFAEAWNKRATLLFKLSMFERSIEDCQRVLELKPRHFGCLSGLGMCYNSLGNEKEAVKYFKEALTVHPWMSGTRATLDRFERQPILDKLLVPMISKAAVALQSREGEVSSSAEGASDEAAVLLAQKFETATRTEGLSVSWDVHETKLEEFDSTSKAYLFRASVKNEAVGPCPVRSLGRFYYVKFSDGRGFPLVRPTEGPAEFMLEPGQVYGYAWSFVVKNELAGMAGGMLLERMDNVCKADEERYVPLGMDSLAFSDAPFINKSRLEDLCQGFLFMGTLDLRPAERS